MVEIGSVDWTPKAPNFWFFRTRQFADETAATRTRVDTLTPLYFATRTLKDE